MDPKGNLIAPVAPNSSPASHPEEACIPVAPNTNTESSSEAGLKGDSECCNDSCDVSSAHSSLSKKAQNSKPYLETSPREAKESSHEIMHISSPMIPKHKPPILGQSCSDSPQYQSLANQPRISLPPKETRTCQLSMNEDQFESEQARPQKKRKSEDSNTVGLPSHLKRSLGSGAISSSLMDAVTAARSSSMEGDSDEFDEDSSNKKLRFSFPDGDNFNPVNKDKKSASPLLATKRSSPTVRGLPGRGVVSPNQIRTMTAESSLCSSNPMRTKATSLAATQDTNSNKEGKADHNESTATARPSVEHVDAEKGGIFDDAEEDFHIPHMTTLQSKRAFHTEDSKSASSGSDTDLTAAAPQSASVFPDTSASEARPASQDLNAFSGSYLLSNNAVANPMIFSGMDLRDKAGKAMQLSHYPYSGVGLSDYITADSTVLHQLAFLQSLGARDDSNGNTGTQIHEKSAPLQTPHPSDSEFARATSMESTAVLQRLAPRDDEYISTAVSEMTQKMPTPSSSSDVDTTPPQQLSNFEPRAPGDDGDKKSNSGLHEEADSEKKSKKGKRKRPKEKEKKMILPTPGVTTSPKDRKIAEATLSGADDLLSLLSDEDCRFLGSNFWIFTIQQLEHVLLGDEFDTDESDTGIARDSAQKRENLRTLLVHELATSALRMKVKDNADTAAKLIDADVSDRQDETEQMVSASDRSSGRISPQSTESSDRGSPLLNANVLVNSKSVSDRTNGVGDHPPESPLVLPSNGEGSVLSAADESPATADRPTLSALIGERNAELTNVDECIHEMPLELFAKATTALTMDVSTHSASSAESSKVNHLIGCSPESLSVLPSTGAREKESPLVGTGAMVIERPAHSSPSTEQTRKPLSAVRMDEACEHLRVSRGQGDVSSSNEELVVAVGGITDSISMADQAKDGTCVSEFSAQKQVMLPSTGLENVESSAMETTVMTVEGHTHSVTSPGQNNATDQMKMSTKHSTEGTSALPLTGPKNAYSISGTSQANALTTTDQDKESFKQNIESPIAPPSTGAGDADSFAAETTTAYRTRRSASSADQSIEAPCVSTKLPETPVQLPSTEARDVNSSSADTDVRETVGPTHAVGEQLKKESMDDTLLEAELRVKKWENAIRQWKSQAKKLGDGGEEKTESKEMPLRDIETRFPLQGPLSCLFPPLFRNFLSSMSVDTAFKFLSTKKTEASGLIYAFQLWRVKCNMPPLKASTLARNMLGLQSRLKTAVTSIPPADEYTRTWMGCELVVMTGSAKEFLIDNCRLENGYVFVNARTKDMSDRLVAWRESKHLPPLKGSGKVAMISAWKTAMKETVEAEQGEGKVMAESEFLSDKICPFPLDSSTRPYVPKGPASKSTSSLSLKKELEAATKSQTFFAECLKPDVVAFLGTQGIRNAGDLLEFREKPASSVLSALAEFAKRDLPGGVDVNPMSCMNRWAVWVKLVEDKLNEISQQKKKRWKKRKKSSKKQDSHESSTSEKAKKVADVADHEDGLDSMNISTRDNALRARSVAAEKKIEIAVGKELEQLKEAGEEIASKEKAKCGIHIGVKPVGKKSKIAEQGDTREDDEKEVSRKESKKIAGSADPFDTLSKNTRKFLEAQGIRSGDELLNAKTTVVARAFIDWREAQNMTVLKGQGAIASVSGWKGIIRKASESGSNSLVDNAPTPVSSKDGTKTVSPKQQTSERKRTSGAMECDFMMHPHVLMGLPSREITVCNNAGVLYDFELSIRKPGENARKMMCFPPGLGVYLSYKGSRQRQSHLKCTSGNPTRSPVPSCRDVPTMRNEPTVGKTNIGLFSLPILSDVTIDDCGNDANEGLFPAFCAPFSSNEPGCGLIELGLYGVRPFADYDQTDELKREIEKFLCCGIDVTSAAEMECEITSPTSTTIIAPQSSTVHPSLGKAVAEADDSSTKSCDASVANVFPVDTAYGMQYFLYLADPMEKGQTIELRFFQETQNAIEAGMLSKKNGIQSDLGSRIALEKDISSLSLQELKSVHSFLLSSIGKPIIAEGPRFIKNPIEGNMDETEISRCSDKEFLNYVVSRRRLHWVATIVKAKISNLYGVFRTMKSTVLAKAINGVSLIEKSLDSLSWNMNLTNALNSVQDDGLLFNTIRDEIACEIVVGLTRKGHLKRSFDHTVWCPMSSMLLRRCLEHVSTYALRNDFNLLTSQQTLVNALLSCVSDAVKLLLSPEINIKDFEFSSTSSSSENSLDLQKLSGNPNQTEFLVVAPGILPHEYAAHLANVQKYRDAICLCDEHPYAAEIDSFDKVLQRQSLVAAKAPWQVPPVARGCSEDCMFGDVVMRTTTDCSAGNASLHVRWYVEHQILPVAHAVATCNIVAWTSLPNSSGEPTRIYDYACLTETVNGVIMSHKKEPIELAFHKAPFGGFVESMRLKALESRNPPKPVPCSPRALQLFLGTVWPKLRSGYGWQLGSFDGPDDVVFFSPGRKSPDKMTSGLKIIEEQKERKRIGAKHLGEIDTIGLGHLTRVLKCTFANSIESLAKDEERMSDSKHSAIDPVLTVKEVLGHFLQAVVEDLPSKGHSARVQDITQGILACFDKLAPMLLCPLDKVGDKTGSESLGSEYLLRFIVLLPCLLKKSGIPTRQLQDTTAVLQELSQFLAANCEKSFNESILPPLQENSEGSVKRTPFIASRIGKLVSAKPKNDARSMPGEKSTGERIEEIVLPEDKPLLTDFTSLVMSQTLPYRASAEDISKKGRRNVRVGTPGLLCRHCKGTSGEGTYFFSSVDSFGTAATVVHSHMNRCPDCPVSIKKKLQHSKARHSEQRKKLKFGSQAEFFGRVWRRLHNLRTTVVREPSNPKITQELPTDTSHREQQHEGVPHEFHSHVSLMSYLVHTPGWMEREDMRERIELYYKCLEEGGKIYHTSAMPANFNSEWLLEKHPVARGSRQSFARRRLRNEA